MKQASGLKRDKTLFDRKLVNLEEVVNRMHRYTSPRHSNDRRKRRETTTKRHAVTPNKTPSKSNRLRTSIFSQPLRESSVCCATIAERKATIYRIYYSCVP